MTFGNSSATSIRESWAVVTGASSGIGKEFARQLAGEGVHLLLVARRLELLEEIAEELRGIHQVEVRCMGLDLSEKDSAEKIVESCEGLKIDLLVNNAGSGIPGEFTECNLKDETALLQLNCLTAMTLARGFLPQFIEQKRGGIIFVSSLMGFQGVPYMAHYSAAKAYLLNLGEAIHHEVRDKGVDVLVLAPGATDTPGKDLHPVDYDKLPIRWMSPEAVVSAALKGLAQRRSLIIPGWKNHFVGCLGGGLWSRGLVQRVMARLARIALPLKKG